MSPQFILKLPICDLDKKRYEGYELKGRPKKYFLKNLFLNILMFHQLKMKSKKKILDAPTLLGICKKSYA